MNAATELLTLGQVAARLGTSTHRLKYAIEVHRIEPIRRIGIARVWRETDLPRIQAALDQIALRRNCNPATPSETGVPAAAAVESPQTTRPAGHGGTVRGECCDCRIISHRVELSTTPSSSATSAPGP